MIQALINIFWRQKLVCLECAVKVKNNNSDRNNQKIRIEKPTSLEVFSFFSFYEQFGFRVSSLCCKPDFEQFDCNIFLQLYRPFSQMTGVLLSPHLFCATSLPSESLAQVNQTPKLTLYRSILSSSPAMSVCRREISLSIFFITDWSSFSDVTWSVSMASAP